jgi:hypothetical protein
VCVCVCVCVCVLCTLCCVLCAVCCMLCARRERYLRTRNEGTSQTREGSCPKNLIHIRLVASAKVFPPQALHRILVREEDYRIQKTDRHHGGAYPLVQAADAFGLEGGSSTLDNAYAFPGGLRLLSNPDGVDWLGRKDPSTARKATGDDFVHGLPLEKGCRGERLERIREAIRPWSF